MNTDEHLFDQPILYGDVASNHHGSRKIYEELVQNIENSGAVPKIQLFSKHTFDRSWPIPETFVASVFRPSDLDFILPHKPLALKIASVESTYWELIDLARQTDLPMIVSTGGMDDDELAQLLSQSPGYGAGLCLMHCVSMYPTPLEHCNMLRLTTIAEAMEDMFLEPWTGWSCHTSLSWREPLIAAITQGASQFEVHVLPDRTVPRTDDERSSLLVRELAEFQGVMRAADQLLGTGDIEQADREAVLGWRSRWLK
jgi:sialic acid synthase SpsE